MAWVLRMQGETVSMPVVHLGWRGGDVKIEKSDKGETVVCLELRKE